MVSEHISDCLGIDLLTSPKHFLLHPYLFHTTKCSALPHLLVAKCLIPVHWKSLHIQSELGWVRKVRKIMEAKDWLAACKDTRKRFKSTWTTWRDHIHGSASVSSSLDIALLALADPAFKQLGPKLCSRQPYFPRLTLRKRNGCEHFVINMWAVT